MRNKLAVHFSLKNLENLATTVLQQLLWGVTPHREITQFSTKYSQAHIYTKLVFLSCSS